MTYPAANLSASQQSDLYAELATGAESGWDYSSRWLRDPTAAVFDDNLPLRSLNLRNTVPVDLNSILFGTENALAEFHLMMGNNTAAKQWAIKAEARKNAMFDVLFNASYWGYFDFNLTSNAQNTNGLTGNSTTLTTDGRLFNPGQLYPYWTQAVPDLLAEPQNVELAYQGVAQMLDAQPGAIPATNLETTQQWDSPSVWPPLMYIMIQGLRNYAPPLENATVSDNSNGTSAQNSLRNLAFELSDRYMLSAFCTWRSTGGSIPNVLPQLQGSDPTANGTIFEKYANNATDIAGSGGEYSVVPGFGWSNALIITAAEWYGSMLRDPDCGTIQAAQTTTASMKRRRRFAKRSREHQNWMFSLSDEEFEGRRAFALAQLVH